MPGGGRPSTQPKPGEMVRDCALRHLHGRAVPALPDNVQSFNNLPGSETPWTKNPWFYDQRTGKHLALKTPAQAGLVCPGGHCARLRRRWPLEGG